MPDNLHRKPSADDQKFVVLTPRERVEKKTAKLFERWEQAPTTAPNRANTELEHKE
jgi:hypothetical protein